MSHQLTTIRDYLTRAKHYYSNAIKGMENWDISPNCIFKTKEQLEKYEQDNYEQDVKDWRTAFSIWCLENNILNADAKMFEEFFDFDLSPIQKSYFQTRLLKYLDNFIIALKKCLRNSLKFAIQIW